MNLAMHAGFVWPTLPRPIEEDDRQRGILVTSDVNKMLTGEVVEPWFNRGRANALLIGFVRGIRLRVNRKECRCKGAHLRQLVRADELWELCFRYRGLFGSGARLLGRFKTRDLFVGLKLVPRHPTVDTEFAGAINVWNAMLPTADFVTSPVLSNYLSENYREHPCDR